MLCEGESLLARRRECGVLMRWLWGQYMLPPIFVFVVLVLGFGLWVYRRAREEP